MFIIQTELQGVSVIYPQSALNNPIFYLKCESNSSGTPGFNFS